MRIFHSHIVAAIALIVVIAVIDGCHGGASGSRARPIDWHTSPLDLDLRGMNGSSYRFDCPPGKPAPELVTGTGVYTDASSICSAAVHAGAIDAQRGGEVVIQILHGQPSYQGSTQNFVHSRSLPEPWGGSFAVLPANAR